MKDEAPRLAVKLNNCASNDPCAICNDRTDPEVGPELFLDGTWELVCYRCGGEYAPHLVDILLFTRDAKYKRAEEREAVGSHEDPWAVGYDDPLYQGHADFVRLLHRLRTESQYKPSRILPR